MRLPALDRYQGEKEQEEGSKDSQYTLQVCVRFLELLQLSLDRLGRFIEQCILILRHGVVCRRSFVAAAEDIEREHVKGQAATTTIPARGRVGT